jgi:hypothetical protein
MAHITSGRSNDRSVKRILGVWLGAYGPMERPTGAIRVFQKCTDVKKRLSTNRPSPAGRVRILWLFLEDGRGETGWMPLPS